MADILDDKHKKVNPDKVVPNEYQSKCEILMDLCLKHFDRHRAMLFDDYNNLMTQAQEEYDNQTKEG